MSDDSHTSPRAGSPDDSAGEPAFLFRLAIVSRAQQAADALWSALDHRARSRNRQPQTHAAREDADVIVYLPAEDDFASESAVRSFEADIARDPAQRKIVFEPAAVHMAGAPDRINHLRDRLGAQGAIEWVPAKEPTDGEGAGERSARHRARQVERLLEGKTSTSKVDIAPAVEKEEGRRRKSDKPQKERSAVRAEKKEARRTARANQGPRAERGRASESSREANKAAPEKKARPAKAKVVGTKPQVPIRKPSKPAVVAPAKIRERPEKPPALPPVSIALSGLSEEEKAALMESLRHAFRESGARVLEAKPLSKAHISVHAFDDHPSDSNEVERLAHDLVSKGRLRILLDRTASRAAKDAENKEPEKAAVAQTSLLCQGALLDLDALFGRHGIDAMSVDTEQRVAGYNLMAALIVRQAANLPKPALTRRPLDPPPDIANALRLADAPLELLSQLSWSAPSPPKGLHAQYTQADVERFADRKIVLSDDDTRDFSGPIEWHSTVADGRAASRLFGLGFLIAPLSYWYSKASDRKGEQLDKIDASLKQRGVTASALLANAGDIIRDFLEKMPPQASSAAWTESLVSTRIRALTFYVLCCRLAVKRRIKFDEAACGAVFRGLIDHIEFLRSELRYPLVAVEGVERDSLLAGTALALQPTDYGSVLLRESLERLRRRQLDIGLSADGVWRNGSFAAHCAVLSALTVLLGDLAATAAVEPIAEYARKMTLFVDAMLKSNGEPLPIDGVRAKSYASTLSGARRVLATVGARPSKGKPGKGMAANRITETYVFRDAQYFVSHSTPRLTPESSQVAFHAKAGSGAKAQNGGLLLAFAHGPSSLLLGLVPYRKELAGITNLAPGNPALRNGYLPARATDGETKGGPRARASIVKSWRGPGWVAARGIESGSQGELARTIVHLKDLHALLVVDEIAGIAKEAATVEQFWHLDPNLVLPENPDGSLRFNVPDDGSLTVAFDGQPAVSIDRDAFSACIRRSAGSAQHVLASLFLWTTAPAAANLSVHAEEPDGWRVCVSGTGPSLSVSLASSGLRVEGIVAPNDDAADNP